MVSVLSADQAISESWQAEIALDALAVPEALHDLPLSQVSGGWPRSALQTRAGVQPDWQLRAVENLSGGQKARLALLLLRLQRPNFHLLDEPTNHLDIEGQEALEAELLAPDATCLLVSHDRHFVRAVGSRFWEIRGKRREKVDGPEGFFAAMRR